MNSINFPMLGIALLTAICIMLIGVSIALRSVLGIVLSIVAVFIVTGFGFVTKKKLRKKGRI